MEMSIGSWLVFTTCSFSFIFFTETVQGVIYAAAANLSDNNRLQNTIQNATFTERHPTKPTICKYLITKKYECLVPVSCNQTDDNFSCSEDVNGVWTDAQDIVHYHDVCVWTDHFSTCTFNVDATYECRMVWEQRHHPRGSYVGDARTGFRRAASATMEAAPRFRKSSRPVRSSRFRRAGGGTC